VRIIKLATVLAVFTLVLPMIVTAELAEVKDGEGNVIGYKEVVQEGNTTTETFFGVDKTTVLMKKITTVEERDVAST